MVPSFKISEESQIVVAGNVGLSGTGIIYGLFEDEYKARYAGSFLSPIHEYKVIYDYEREYSILKELKYELIVECGFGGVFKDSAMKLVKMPESYTDEEGNTCNYYEFYVSWDLNWGTLKDDEIIDFLSRLDVEIKDSLGNEKYRGATDINRVDY